MPHRVIIHCGLHKTGTKAVQAFLHTAAPQLRALGVLVASAGRPAGFTGGNHNIAWELSRDRRFDPAHGDLAALAGEIAGFDGDAVISAEDFESCLAVPERLLPLLRHPRLRGRDFVLAIYVRDQISYAESLLVENVRHSCGEECLQTVQDILSAGELRVREWRFLFDYARRLAVAATLAPVQVVFRGHDPRAGGSVGDFMASLFPDLPRPPGHADQRVNPRPKLLTALAMFHASRLTRPQTTRETLAAWLLAGQVGEATAVLPPWLRTAFVRRFAPGNDAFCRATGVAPAALDLSATAGAAAAGALFMDCVYSFETHVAITRLAELLPDGATPAGLALDRLPKPARDLVLATTAAWRRERAPG